MAGTAKGGKAAAATNKARHGADFYAKIGAKGGANGVTGGFAANRELARKAGAMGGRISRRRKAVVAVSDDAVANDTTVNDAAVKTEA